MIDMIGKDSDANFENILGYTVDISQYGSLQVDARICTVHETIKEKQKNC